MRVVTKVPDFIMERFGHNISNVPNFKIKAWSPIHLYKDLVLPKLMEERSVDDLYMNLFHNFLDNYCSYVSIQAHQNLTICKSAIR